MAGADRRGRRHRDDPARLLVTGNGAGQGELVDRMKLLPRNLYFRHGRVRLYPRLYACAKVLVLIAAGALGIVYWMGRK